MDFNLPIHRERLRLKILQILLIAGIVFSITPVLKAPFVLDDQAAIVKHPVVNGHAPISDIGCYDVLGRRLLRCAKDSSSARAGIIRPLETALFRMQWKIFDGHPLGFRLISVIALILLIFEISKFLRTIGFTMELALGTTALFSALAIHIDAIAVIHNSTTIWVLLLSVAGMNALFGRHSWIAPLALLLGFGLKESIVMMVPAASWLAIYYPKARRYRTLVSLWVLLVSMLALRTFVIPANINEWTLPADNLLINFSLLHRIFGGINLFGRYICLMIWPLHLSFDYSYSAITLNNPINSGYFFVGLASAIILAVLVIISIKRRSSKAWALTGFLAGIFGAQGLFVSNIMTPLTIIFAERLFFEASLWLVALFMFGAWLITRRTAIYRVPLQVVFLVIFTFQLSMSFKRANQWSGPTSLYHSQVYTQPASLKGQLYWARELERLNRPLAALWHLTLVLDGKRHFPKPWHPLPRPKDATGILTKIPQILAPDTPPRKVWKKLSVIARETLGPNSARLSAQMANRNE